MLGTVLNISYKINKKDLVSVLKVGKTDVKNIFHIFGSRGDKVQIKVRGPHQTQEVCVLFYVHWKKQEKDLKKESFVIQVTFYLALSGCCREL